MKTTAAKELPMLFSVEMVRAILDGQKTQTRRVIKPQPPEGIDELHGFKLRERSPYRLDDPETGCILGNGFWDDSGRAYRCPYESGIQLWVRETFTELVEHHRPPRWVYRASCTDSDGERCRQDYINCGYPYQWKPSIHMPREASRIQLRVTDVRVERVQDISEKDAQAEGVDFPGPYSGVGGKTHPTCIDAFHELWDSINKSRGFGWHINPWVWVVQFER